jgi:hypothetical protein
LKAGRPTNSKQDPLKLEAFKKPRLGLELLKQYAEHMLPQFSGSRYFCEDESRFGLHTLVGRLISACGIKPLGQWQWKFQTFWYGAVEPASGEHFSGSSLTLIPTAISGFRAVFASLC